jgi:hypothetical protein
MPTKPANKTKRSAGENGTTARRAAAAPSQIERGKQRAILDNIESVHGAYPSQNETENAVKALKRAGFKENDISLSPLFSGKVADSVAATNIERNTYADPKGLGGTVARIAGTVLGLGSVALAAPIIVALGLGRQLDLVEVPILVEVNTGNPDLAKEAARVLLRSGGQQVGLVGQYGFVDTDLKNREYRDETGRIHHHTHTYMRDHGDVQRSFAA